MAFPESLSKDSRNGCLKEKRSTSERGPLGSRTLGGFRISRIVGWAYFLRQSGLLRHRGPPDLRVKLARRRQAGRAG